MFWKKKKELKTPKKKKIWLINVHHKNGNICRLISDTKEENERRMKRLVNDMKKKEFVNVSSNKTESIIRADDISIITRYKHSVEW